MRKLFNLQTNQDGQLSKSYMGLTTQTPKVDKKTDKDLLSASNDTWIGKVGETGTGTLREDSEVQRKIDNMGNPTSYAPSIGLPASPRSTFTHTKTQLADVDSYIGKVFEVGTNKTGMNNERNASIDNLCGKSYQVLGE